MSTLWGEEGQDEFIHEYPDDAIEWIIDSAFPTDIRELGDITVIEVEHVKPYFGYRSGWALKYVLEGLDEEYGSPDSDTEPTEKMVDAEKTFIDVVLSEYKVWTVKPTGESVTVNALEWTKKSHPGWLINT